ncbi:hypothetical protein [Alphaproteobacteria bacterium endosymbiont of Tiliacea citrago]|uniref:hypothetical protein n=1 Tax=Alphaproteobacteria bacterium endosymbiont of Tiliacea citrago TaxID=3077944 RepID=UPI00313BFA35
MSFVSKGLGVVFLSVFLFFFYFAFLDFYKNDCAIKLISQHLLSLRSEKSYLEGNVNSFRGPEIDRDLLETQARDMLASLNPKEIVFFWKESAGENIDIYNF